jgi:hypothetical protein
MTKSEKIYTPRTKHIALKYHHFRSFVDKNIIRILSISTKEQIADILTKPLKIPTFEWLVKSCDDNLGLWGSVGFHNRNITRHKIYHSRLKYTSNSRK